MKNLETETPSSSSSGSSELNHESTYVALPSVPNPTSSTAGHWNPWVQRFESSPGLDHGSTNAAPRPAPIQIPVPPTAIPFRSSSVPTSPTRRPWEDNFLNAPGPGDNTLSQIGNDESHGPVHSQTSSGYSSDYALSEAEEHMYVPKPNYYSAPSTPDSSSDLNLDWEFWTSPTPTPGSPKALGQADEGQVEHASLPPSSGHAPSRPSPGAGSPTETENDVVPRSSTSPDPELHLDHQSSSAGTQPVDNQVAIYDDAKGKAKVSRRISGSARDVGNAA